MRFLLKQICCRSRTLGGLSHALGNASPPGILGIEQGAGSAFEL